MPTQRNDRGDKKGSKTSAVSPQPWTSWLVVAVPSILIVALNLLSAILANVTYVPHQYYERVYDCMTLEGAGAGVVIAMFWVLPPQQLTQTVTSLVLGGAIGAGLGCTAALALRAPPARIGATAFVGSTLAMAIASIILPLPQRHDLALLVAQFLDLLDTHTVQFAIQYGAYPVAILHLDYLPTLLVLAALSLAGTLSLRLAPLPKRFK